MTWDESDPLRPVDWLALTAQSLAKSNRKRLPAGWGRKVQRAWQYARAELDLYDDTKKLPFETRRQRLRSRYPDETVASRIYEGQQLIRYSLEALVVANATPAEIAQQTGLTERQVRLYEERYFDIRSRLKHDTLVANLAYAPALIKGVAGDDPDIYWKMVAHLFGRDVLEAIWNKSPVSDATRLAINQKVKERIGINALGAVHSRNINRHTADKMIEEHTILTGQDKEADGAARVQDALAGVAGMLQAVSIGILTADTSHTSMLAPSDLKAVVKRLAPASEYVKNDEADETDPLEVEAVEVSK